MLFWDFRQQGLFTLQSGQWKQDSRQKKTISVQCILKSAIIKLLSVDSHISMFLFRNCFVFLQFVAVGLLTVIVVGKLFIFRHEIN